MWGEAKNKPTRNLTLGEEVSLPPPPFLFSFFFLPPPSHLFYLSSSLSFSWYSLHRPTVFT